MPPKAPPPFVLNKKLILHFDLADVITFQRPNKQLQVMKLISNFAWGKVEQKDTKSPRVWKLVVPTLMKERPESEEQLMSYRNYVDEINGQGLEGEKIKEQLLMGFTKGPGGKLKTEIEKLLRSITIPKTLSDYINSQQQSKEQVTKQYRKLIQTLSKSYYQILPSFFKLLMSLKKAKREFALIFHAPSTLNHASFIGELNLFFTGEHPFYNGKNSTPLVKFDGSKNCKNFVITPKNTCVLYRCGKEYEDDYATFGTTKSFPDKEIDGIKQKLLQIKEQTKLCKSSQIYIYSHLLLKESAAIYCVDDHGYMMIDQADYDTQQIYFNARDIEIWSCLGDKIETIQGVYGWNVDLFELMRDVEFFIKSVEIGEKNMIGEIERMERGGGEKKGKEEGEKRELSDEEYLKASILPLLEGALRLVDIERPEDPISAIAFYCLKNQHWLVKQGEEKGERS